jgi:magnesium chelatase subunit I
MEYMLQASSTVGIKSAVAKLGVQNNPASIASAVEFILEGLHLNRKLNKDRMDHRARYRR